MIYSKITNQSRVETSQPAPVIETTPTTQSEMVQQPTSDQQALSEAADSHLPAYYSIVGEGDSPQYDYPTAGGGGGDSYYAQALCEQNVTVTVDANQTGAA